MTTATMTELERRALELCANLDTAAREFSEANAARAREWLSDRPGRRSRGARYGAASRRMNAAMDELVSFVQGPEAPATVREHFRTVGPTYYEAAAAAVRAGRFAR